MKTIYAKTLNPEAYDYRVYDIREDDYNEVIIDGGREFSDIDQNGYLKAIKKTISGYNSWDFEYYYHNSIMDYLKDYLPKKENGKRLSPKEAHDIKMSIECWNNDKLSYEDVICDLLWLVTGNLWKSKKLHGCCQGEVVTAYYPADIGMTSYLEWVEAWFFGTGTEVEIHDEDNEPTCAEDVTGYTFYTASWKTEDIIAEIKTYFNEDVEVKLWLFKDTKTISIDEYELAKGE